MAFLTIAAVKDIVVEMYKKPLPVSKYFTSSDLIDGLVDAFGEKFNESKQCSLKLFLSRENVEKDYCKIERNCLFWKDIFRKAISPQKEFFQDNPNLRFKAISDFAKKFSILFALNENQELQPKTFIYIIVAVIAKLLQGIKGDGFDLCEILPESAVRCFESTCKKEALWTKPLCIPSIYLKMYPNCGDSSHLEPRFGVQGGIKKIDEINVAGPYSRLPGLIDALQIENAFLEENRRKYLIEIKLLEEKIEANVIKINRLKQKVAEQKENERLGKAVRQTMSPSNLSKVLDILGRIKTHFGDEDVCESLKKIALQRGVHIESENESEDDTSAPATPGRRFEDECFDEPSCSTPIQGKRKASASCEAAKKRKNEIHNYNESEKSKFKTKRKKLEDEKRKKLEEEKREMAKEEKTKKLEEEERQKVTRGETRKVTRGETRNVTRGETRKVIRGEKTKGQRGETTKVEKQEKEKIEKCKEAQEEEENFSVKEVNVKEESKEDNLIEDEDSVSEFSDEVRESENSDSECSSVIIPYFKK